VVSFESFGDKLLESELSVSGPFLQLAETIHKYGIAHDFNPKHD
jgi:hypothetical protein